MKFDLEYETTRLGRIAERIAYPRAGFLAADQVADLRGEILRALLREAKKATANSRIASIRKVYRATSPEEEMMDDRFMLATDNDGHWYIIPYDKRKVWESVVRAAEDGMEPPGWVTRLNGGPGGIWFRGWDSVEES